MTPDQEKVALIRTLGRVINFDSVEEGAKLHEAFPHSPAEISSRAAAGPPPWRERGILRALRETGTLESGRAQALLVQSQRRKQQRTSHHSFSTLSQHCQGTPLWLIHCLRQGKEKKNCAHTVISCGGGIDSQEAWNWRLTYCPFSSL